MVVCAYEDRVSDLVGLKLLVLSLAQHCPGLPIHLFCPSATPEFCQWIEKYPQVQLRELPNLNIKGWNVKPDILMYLLDEGHEQAIWIDSDIIVTKDFRPLLAHLTDDTLVVAQENCWESSKGSVERTKAWGLSHGRSLVDVACSCVIRVTPAHRRLLEAWKQYLADPVYLEAQPKWPRPFHLMGDQDVLTALLGSSEFADIKLHWLRRGVDIAQCFRADGYTVGERLANLFSGLPVFVHAQGPKPWRDKGKDGVATGVAVTYLELSPYCFAARPYSEQLNEDTSWINIESTLGKVLHTLTFGNPSLQGLPLALQAQMQRVGIRSAVKHLLSR